MAPRPRALAAPLIACLALAAASPAVAREATVTSFDGAQIATSFFPAESLAPGATAPTVLMGHGWAGTRQRNDQSASAPAGVIGTAALRRAGYNVLSWDARGFGASSGVVGIAGPEAEGRDVSALLDHVAAQPEALLDGAKDPRVGMVGGSYGGGIQLVAAGLDRRIDAIVPDIAWHSLRTSLYKTDIYKAGFGNGLYVTGKLAAEAADAGLAPQITRAWREGNAGPLSRASFDWFVARGPGDELVGRITAPTFLTQGTNDALFTLQEAIDSYDVLREDGTPVKMLWHCGGHSGCNSDPGTDTTRIERLTLSWFASALRRDGAARTGPRFEYVTQDGVWHTAPDYPLPPGRPAAFQRAGRLALRPGIGVGSLAASEPDPSAFRVPITVPRGVDQLVGAPTLTLRYRGTGDRRTTHVFAQLVGAPAGKVVGGHATPVPLTLDGRDRSVTVPMEPVALARMGGAALELEVLGATQLYRRQLATGSVRLTAAVRLPTVGTTRPAAPVVRVSTPAAARAGLRRVVVAVRSSRPLRRLAVRVVAPDGTPAGTVRAQGAIRRMTVPVEIPERLTAGPHTVRVAWLSADGARGARTTSLRVG